MTNDGRTETEDGGRRTEDGGRRTEDGCGHDNEKPDNYCFSNARKQLGSLQIFRSFLPQQHLIPHPPPNFSQLFSRSNMHLFLIHIYKSVSEFHLLSVYPTSHGHMRLDIDFTCPSHGPRHVCSALLRTTAGWCCLFMTLTH